jgi:hypothetical protein
LALLAQSTLARLPDPLCWRRAGSAAQRIVAYTHKLPFAVTVMFVVSAEGNLIATARDSRNRHSQRPSARP